MAQYFQFTLSERTKSQPHASEGKGTVTSEGLATLLHGKTIKKVEFPRDDTVRFDFTNGEKLEIYVGGSFTRLEYYRTVK